jgi:membrane protein
MEIRRAVDVALRGFDDAQRRRAWIGFPVAVVKKFGDDRAGYLGALIAYYGFFSVFPLLLVFVTLVGLVLGTGSDLAVRIQDSALAQFPVIGDQIRVDALGGSVLALTIGAITALWAGMGVTLAAQNAMNEIWAIRRAERPNFLVSRLRSLLMLASLGTFVVASTILSGVAASVGTGVIPRVASIAASLIVNLALFMLAYRVLTRRDLSWKDVAPGAAFAAVAWTGLQAIGTFLVQRQITNARATYGVFALVIGLLFWISLGAQLTLFGAEVNVVRVDRLWPRGLRQPPLTAADRETYASAAEAEERREQEHIDVSFDEPGKNGSTPRERASKAPG